MVTVCDGTGREWTAELTLATPRRAQARLLEEHPPETPPRLAVTLAQVVPRGAAMDLIVAKATELGVSRIVPLEAEHSVRRTAVSGGEARWRRIIVEATEQCGRRRLPELAPACAVEQYLRSIRRARCFSSATTAAALGRWPRCAARCRPRRGGGLGRRRGRAQPRGSRAGHPARGPAGLPGAALAARRDGGSGGAGGRAGVCGRLDLGRRWSGRRGPGTAGRPGCRVSSSWTTSEAC